MNNGGLNNAAFYDYSSDEELDQIEGDNQAFGMAMNRAAGPVRLLAQRRQLPAVPAPLPIQTPPIAIGNHKISVYLPHLLHDIYDNKVGNYLLRLVM